MLEGNELLSHENTWKKPKCILLSERSQSGKATYYLIPTIRHSLKDKTMENSWLNKNNDKNYYLMEKRPVVVRTWSMVVGVGGGWIGRVQKIFRRVEKLWMISEWWIHFFIHSPKPKEWTHQEWALVITMDFGWLWCVNVVISVVTNVPLWCITWTMGKATHLWWQGYTGNLCTLPLILLYTLNCF